MSVRNVAAAILEQLSAWGVTKVYGFIGDDIFYLLDAIAHQSEISFYQVRHEESAALMASAHAKLTGQPGVCIADGGPGTLHLLNGLADAFTDKAPVIAITGQVARAQIGTNAKQYVNQQLLMSGLSVYSDIAADPKAVIKVMGLAYRSAVSNMSVAHISVPMDVFSMPCEERALPLPPYLTNHPQSSQNVMDGAAEKINKAERPVVLVGRGGQKAGKLINELASGCGAGIVTTMSGMGVVDKSHPLYTGGLGHAGSPASTAVLAKSDLCIIVGANWWPTKYVPQNIPAIEIDINPANMGSSPQGAYGVVGDSSAVLSYIVKRLEPKNNIQWRELIQSEIGNWMNILQQETTTDGTPIHPAVVIKAIEKTVPQDAVLCLDTGDNTVWFGRIFRPARQRILLSGKWRTMGFGLPAAISAKINYPEQKVVAIVGDGGFSMTMADLITAVKYNLPIVVVVLNNNSLAMEKNKMQAGNLVPEGTSLLNHDFAGFAKICGADGIYVEEAEQLEEALTTALNSSKPVVVDVRTSSVPVPGTAMPG
ncbi:MAG TPA: thiamine pyrophosphate-binding protein [Desulfobacteria bacterium]|nr:thiamine pyrophosphate-binding protein [Desulfobacteria bacterium]